MASAGLAAPKQERVIYKTPGWETLGKKILTEGVRRRGLGAGGYGEARIMQYGGQEYVVKTSLETENAEYASHRFKKEIEMCEMAARRIPEITSEFIGGVVTNLRAVIIFKYVPGMTLAEYIRQPGIDKKRLVRDIESAIERISAAGMEHRDIKLDNIYIEDPYRLVIIDWGLSLMLGDPVLRNDPLHGQQEMANGTLNRKNRNVVVREIGSAAAAQLQLPLRVGPPRFNSPAAGGQGPPVAVIRKELPRVYGATAPRLQNYTPLNDFSRYEGPIEVIVQEGGSRRRRRNKRIRQRKRNTRKHPR
jgi:serine/threonine protein kinase